MRATYQLAQRNAIGIAVLLNIVVPFCLFPYKGNIYNFSPIAFWLFRESQTLLLPVLSMWVLAKNFSVSPKAYGLPIPPHFNGDLIGLSGLVAFSIGAAYWPTSQITWRFLSPYVVIPSFTYHHVLPDGIFHLLSVAAMSLEAGIFESVIFIGLPWLLIRKPSQLVTTKIAFAIASSLIFAANHRGNGLPEIIATFFFGLVAVLWYIKIKELWPVVIGHAVVDIFVLE